MNKIIVFPNDNGGISFCYPVEDCGLTIQQIAKKDVPAGKPYLIVPIDQIPQDHTFFSAFEANFSSPNGYGIGADAWFAMQKEKENI